MAQPQWWLGAPALGLPGGEQVPTARPGLGAGAGGGHLHAHSLLPSCFPVPCPIGAAHGAGAAPGLHFVLQRGRSPWSDHGSGFLAPATHSCLVCRPLPGGHLAGAS